MNWTRNWKAEDIDLSDMQTTGAIFVRAGKVWKEPWKNIIPFIEGNYFESKQEENGGVSHQQSHKYLGWLFIDIKVNADSEYTQSR